jgi:O-antigen/teichoic acid export membrane protein
LVARILGDSVYGELGIIQSTVGMFGVFAGFGLGLTATKHVAEFRQIDPARAGRIIRLSDLVALATGGLMALGLFILAPQLAAHTLNASHLSGPLRIGALVLFFNALNGAQTGALAGLESFRVIAYVNSAVGLISFPVLICGSRLGGLGGAVWALAINLGINWLLNHVALHKESRRHEVPLKFKNCTRELPVLWRFTLPAVLGAALVGPVNWACAALLVNQAGGYSEMGIFTAANQWRMAVLFIPTMLGQVILPVLSNLSAHSSIEHYRKILRINIAMNAGLALIVVIPLVLFAHQLMSAYGPEFERGVNVFRIQALTAVLMAVNSVVGQAITSKGKMWIGFSFNALWAVAVMTLTELLLYNGYKAVGLSSANSIAYLLHTCWQALYLNSVLTSKDSRKR